MKFPEPSPVKGRPVRFAPCAPGASPRMRNAGAGISEAGNRAGPVDLVLIGASTGFAQSTAVVAQAGAAFAGDDGLVNLRKDRGRRCSSANRHLIHDSGGDAKARCHCKQLL